MFHMLEKKNTKHKLMHGCMSNERIRYAAKYHQTVTTGMF